MLDLLPDELLLLVFLYLDKFDLIYAFENLNHRFQRIIEPLTYDIDLTRSGNFFYRQFWFFCNHIIPRYALNIRSLTLTPHHQPRLFQSHIRYLSNLKSLTIKDDQSNKFNYKTELHHFLVESLALPSLCELSIFFPEEDFLSDEILQTISSCSTPNLNRITLIYLDGLGSFKNVLPMPYITHFSVNWKYADPLNELFEVMPNLQHLKLSIPCSRILKTSELLKVPQTLEKLHLELREGNRGGPTYVHYSMPLIRPSFRHLKLFLNVFKSQLRSLTLILTSLKNHFSDFDIFQSLVSDFTRLETFEYYIRTNQKSNLHFPNIEQLPDSSYSIYTLPQPQQFESISEKTMNYYFFDSKLTLQNLFNCHQLQCRNPHISVPTMFQLEDNLKLINLRQIMFFETTDMFPSNICRYLAKIIAHSPNLNYLFFFSMDTEKLIKFLHDVMPVKQSKQITYFGLSLTSSVATHGRTLFYDLSLIFPNLTTFTIALSSEADYCLTSFRSFIEELQSCFRRLNRVRFAMCTMTLTLQEVFGRCESELNSQNVQNLLCYTAKKQNYSSILNIWL